MGSGKVNLIGYYENNNEGLDHYLHYLDEYRTANKVVYARHFVPHDTQHHEFSTGLERVVTAQRLGYTLTVVPKVDLIDGHNAVRALLPLCSFDSEKCKRGINCLDFYRKKWNDNLKVYYDEPLHDQWSHGASAFMYLAVGLRTFGIGNGGLTPSKIKEMRQRAGLQ